MKFKRIAVILVGHFRTFPHLNNHYHKFFHSMSDKVDYFPVIWNRIDFQSSDEVRAEWTANCFGSNLKKLTILSESNLDIDPLDRVLKLSYLAKLGAIEKSKVEKDEGFLYDYVVEVRSDLYFSSPWNLKFHNLKDNQIIIHGGKLFNTGDITESNHPRKWNSELDSVKEFSSGDWYFRMNSITYDKFSNRYDFLKSIDRDITEDFHVQLGPYFLNHSEFNLQIYTDWNDFWPCWPAHCINDIPKL